MLITEQLPLTGANLLFCERVRDRINQYPDRRAEIITEVGKSYYIYVKDYSKPIYEKSLCKGKSILGWEPPEGWTYVGGAGGA